MHRARRTHPSRPPRIIFFRQHLYLAVYFDFKLQRIPCGIILVNFYCAKGEFTAQNRTYSAKPGWRAKLREQEFTKHYRESYGLVYNYVRLRMPNDPAAEDIVAEAFLQAARHYENFDPRRAKFSTWVIKIASNAMISYWRKNKPTSGLDDLPEKIVSQPAEQEHLIDREFVDQLLSTLGETEREIVVMKYREGYRNIEIASRLDMNPSTVSTKLANALAKMRAIAEGDA